MAKGHYKTEQLDCTEVDSEGKQPALNEHDLRINEQVVKVIDRVKQIQAAARRKPNSLTRMQFLHQIEDTYGFHGHRKIEPSRR